MSKFNEPYAATEASLLRANISQKGYRYDYDPGVHHARFSNANRKAWGTIVYEDSFQYYNEGKCFIFISSDKAGSGRKFTVFSTCDGGYSLTKVDQVDTKAQATRVVEEALEQAANPVAPKSQALKGWMEKFFGSRHKGTKIVGYVVVARNPRDGVVFATDLLTKSKAEKQYQTWVEANETDESYSIEAVDADGFHHVLDMD